MQPISLIPHSESQRLTVIAWAFIEDPCSFPSLCISAPFVAVSLGAWRFIKIFMRWWKAIKSDRQNLPPNHSVSILLQPLQHTGIPCFHCWPLGWSHVISDYAYSMFVCHQQRASLSLCSTSDCHYFWRSEVWDESFRQQKS